MRYFPDTFFATKKNFERYELVLGSITPLASFSRMILSTTSASPGGVGMFFSAHGTWGIVAIRYGLK